MTTEAYDKGVKDKKDNIDEPLPPYTPGTVDYREYVEGYLDTPWPNLFR